MVSASCLKVDGLAVNHACIIHEHKRLPAPVDSHVIERLAADEASNLVNRWLGIENFLRAIDADDSVLLGHADYGLDLVTLSATRTSSKPVRVAMLYTAFFFCLATFFSGKVKTIP